MVKPHSAIKDRNSQRVEPARLLRNAVARVVFIEEAIEEGDSGIVLAAARDLELDVRAAISEYEAAA
jgi:hypothetical protein